MKQKRVRRQTIIRKTAAFVMVLVMGLTCWPAAYAGVGNGNAAKETVGVEASNVKDAMDNVIDSIEALEKIGVMTSGDGVTIASIFSDFATLTDIGKAVGTAFTKTTAFLELIGLVKNQKTEAMVSIAQSLININEKLASMDKKLDEISAQMTVMQANEEFNARANKATQMLSEWNTFEHDYMEEKMDRLMNEYDSMMLNHVSDWILDKAGARQKEDDMLRTDRIVLLYKSSDPQDPDAAFTSVPAAVNNIEPEIKRQDVKKPAIYTMYADDEGFDPRADRFLILSDSFLPAKGDIQWNVDTYRSQLEAFFEDKLKELRDDAKAGGRQDPSQVMGYNMFISTWTDEDISRYADGVTDALLYRINYVMLNESSDFARNVHKEFGEYCKHVAAAQQGVDAMLKTLFLTHAFEYETAEDIKAFCSQMILKTGVYSMFAANIEGMSEFITDSQKEDTAKAMCDTIASIQGLFDNSLVGDDRYCYVTNTLVNYADVTLSGGVHAQYHTRGMVAGYDSFSADKMDISYSSDEEIGSEPVPLGDSNALVIGYLLQSNGQTMDHDYLNAHFSETKRTKKSALITSLRGTQTMPTDAQVLMNSHRVIGSYFKGDPQVYLNRLPGSAGETYVRYREQISGSVLEPQTLSLTQNQPLFATALYEEDHWFWEVDEIALMGGPAGDPSFKENYSVSKTGVGLVSDDYRADYSNSVEYNCLLQVPVKLLRILPGPFPLEDLKSITAELNEISQTRTELDESVNYAELLLMYGGWTSATTKELKGAIKNARTVVKDKNSSSEKLKAALTRLTKAQDKLKAKKSQSMKVKASNKNVKAKLLKKGKQTVKAIKVRNVKGKVTFTKEGVGKKSFTKSENSKYGKYFSLSRKTGKITVRKGIKKGTYNVKVKVSAAGNGNYLPASKTVTVRIKIR